MIFIGRQIKVSLVFLKYTAFVFYPFMWFWDHRSWYESPVIKSFFLGLFPLGSFRHLVQCVFY